MSEDDEIARLAAELRGDDTRMLRQGIVTATSYDAGKTLLSVRWGANAKASTNQRCLSSVTPRVGDVVWGIRDGDDTLVLGPVASALVQAQPVTLLAYARAWASSGGACNGRYGNGLGGGATTRTITTTETDTFMGFTDVPVPRKHLLRFRFQFVAQGGVNAAQESNYVLRSGYGGVPSVSYIERTIRHAPAGLNASAPQGEVLINTPDADNSKLTLKLFASMSANSNTLYRYNSGVDFEFSHITLEDLGPV